MFRKNTFLKTIIIVFLLVLTLGHANVNAIENRNINIRNLVNVAEESSSDEFPDIKLDPDAKITCDTLSDVLDEIQWGYNMLKALTIPLLIVLCALDFSKAVISQDNDLLKKATNSTIKRVVAAILFLFLPTILNLILPMAGIENPLCGIQWVVFSL